MDKLMIVNTVITGLLYFAWKRSDMANTVVKLILFTLFIANILRLCGQI